MELCKCGSMMMPQGGGKLKCRSCGKIVDKKLKKITTKKEKSDKMLIVEKQSTHLPETDKECPECKHGKAYWMILQTRSSDEPPTRFFRCKKCSHTWREYQ
jgi:transcription factor S